MNNLRLIVGLGNPGPDYIWTRHNAGWHILDSLISRFSLGAGKKKFNGEFWGPETLLNTRLLFLKPHTYMNLSGSSVGELVHYYSIEPHQILVIYDDVALDFGKIRIRGKGSAGGQKGMHSILQALKTQEIARLRIGVGAPSAGKEMAHWVLGQFSSDQRKRWGELEDLAWKAVQAWISSDMETAMGQINGLALAEEQKK